MGKAPLSFDGWFRDAKDPERWHLTLKTVSPSVSLCGATLTDLHVVEVNPEGRCATCQDVMMTLKQSG
jgi:hypothetical protein